MKDYSKNHRKGRCKTPQTKWIPVNPFELFRDKHLNNSDSEVRVLTNPEIEDFRNNGYSVDIVDRILPKCTRGYPYKGSGMSIKVVRELNQKSRKQELLERHVVTGLKCNMKNKLMPLYDKILLRKRSVIEIINDELKNVAQLVHSRHRSVFNFVMNVLSVLAAYSFFEKKPSINIDYCIENVDGQLAVIK